MGKAKVADLRPVDIRRRTADERERSYAELYSFPGRRLPCWAIKFRKSLLLTGKLASASQF